MTSELPKLDRLRLAESGRPHSFEEFCCQVFHRSENPQNATYRRIEGRGGDGGVEAIWKLENGEVWAIQAKYSEKFSDQLKTRFSESIETAISNYPSITRFVLCIPFNLTGKKGAKTTPIEGQWAKFDSWISEWESKYDKNGRNIEFLVWDESELLERLASFDVTGGFTNYWFEQQKFTLKWFSDRISNTIKKVGPRYSPELNLESELESTMHTFGRTSVWEDNCVNLVNDFKEAIKQFNDICNDPSYPQCDKSTDIGKGATEIFGIADVIDSELVRIVTNPKVLLDKKIKRNIQEILDKSIILESKIKADALQKYGENADSPQFRQFEANYGAHFPLAPLDQIRTIIEESRKLCSIFQTPSSQIPAGNKLLIRGEAGMGKTHGIMDTAVRRLKYGILSLVFIGEDFDDGDPWNTMIRILGLPSDIGWDSFLSTLNACAEATGKPLIIFIDALNEPDGKRKRWKSLLPSMIDQISGCEFLKICVSCRETYIDAVFEQDFEIPSVTHNGFLGNEYEAQISFFEHYGLDLPAEPLMQEEFSIPLFLKLVCQALRDKKLKSIPTGTYGFSAIIKLLLESKNNIIATRLDYDSRKNRVYEAVLKIAGEMASKNQRFLMIEDIKEIFNEKDTPQSTSMFSQLEKESIITVTEKSSDELGEEGIYEAKFSFERIGDYLIVKKLMEGLPYNNSVFEKGGKLHFLFESENSIRDNSGLIESLSFQWPEARGFELIEVVNTEHKEILWEGFIRSLLLRDPESITHVTENLVMSELRSSKIDKKNKMIDSLLGLAVNPNHPLNVVFLTKYLARYTMINRDPIWANFLSENYSNWEEKVSRYSRVHFIIKSACSQDLPSLSFESADNWGTTLAWFCASPDRRIRDRATLALVCIFRSNPSASQSVIEMFSKLDDEYIEERLLLALYGSILINQSIDEFENVIKFVYERYFNCEHKKTTNASIRDLVRFIVELAVKFSNEALSFDPKLYLAPYESSWPIDFSENPSNLEGVNDMRFPCLEINEFNSDFAKYTIGRSLISEFNLNEIDLDASKIYGLFLTKVIELGYPGYNDNCSIFDNILIQKFGFDRGSVDWVERLGKKYYWIILKQLVGQFSDHCKRIIWRDEYFPDSYPQGFNLRDMDPTDLRQFHTPPIDESNWVNPLPYLIPNFKDREDVKSWIKQDDFGDLEKSLILEDYNEDTWYVLNWSMTWKAEKDDESDNFGIYSGRKIYSIAVDNQINEKFMELFDEKKLNDIYDYPQVLNGFIGEYPENGYFIHDIEHSIQCKDTIDDLPFCHLIMLILRDSSWDDYSNPKSNPSLHVPSIDLIEFGNLKWNGMGGWTDEKNEIQVQDPFWWKNSKYSVALIRIEFLDKYLEKNKLSLITDCIEDKLAGTSNDMRSEKKTLFMRSNGKTEKVSGYTIGMES